MINKELIEEFENYFKKNKNFKIFSDNEVIEINDNNDDCYDDWYLEDFTLEELKKYSDKEVFSSDAEVSREYKVLKNHILKFYKLQINKKRNNKINRILKNTTKYKPFVSGSCKGETCVICGEQATNKVGEEIPTDDPFRARHNLTAYVCRKHFDMIFNNRGKKLKRILK